MVKLWKQYRNKNYAMENYGGIKKRIRLLQAMAPFPSINLQATVKISNFYCKIHILHLAPRKECFSDPFQNKRFFALSNSENLQMTNSREVQMSRYSLVGKKQLWEKEQMLATSIFSFSQNVVKSLFLESWKLGIAWQRIKHFWRIKCLLLEFSSLLPRFYLPYP